MSSSTAYSSSSSDVKVPDRPKTYSEAIADFEADAYVALRIGDPVIWLTHRARVTGPPLGSGMTSSGQRQVLIEGGVEEDSGDCSMIHCMMDIRTYEFSDGTSPASWRALWESDYVKRQAKFGLRKPEWGDEMAAYNALGVGDPIVLEVLGGGMRPDVYRRAVVTRKSFGSCDVKYGSHGQLSESSVSPARTYCLGTFALEDDGVKIEVFEKQIGCKWTDLYQNRRVKYLMPKLSLKPAKVVTDSAAAPGPERRSDLFSDCALVSESGESLKAHRYILSMSSCVFRAKFEYNEKVRRKVVVPQCSSAAAAEGSLEEEPTTSDTIVMECSKEAVDLLLNSMYLARPITGTFEVIREVLRMSHEYQLKGAFKSACEHLNGMIGKDTLQEILCDVNTFRGAAAGLSDVDAKKAEDTTHSLDMLWATALVYISHKSAAAADVIIQLSKRASAAGSLTDPVRASVKRHITEEPDSSNPASDKDEKRPDSKKRKST